MSAHATLRRPEPEFVTLLVRTTTAGRLGEGSATYAPGETVRARVSPITAEQATRAGLSTTVTRLRIRFVPTRPVAVGDRYQLRGRTWEAISVEGRTSYAAALVEARP